MSFLTKLFSFHPLKPGEGIRVVNGKVETVKAPAKKRRKKATKRRKPAKRKKTAKRRKKAHKKPRKPKTGRKKKSHRGASSARMKELRALRNVMP